MANENTKDELENVIISFFSQFKLLISELENNDTSILHDCKYCKKRISDGYQYKCLECDAYYLCNACFEKRRSNYSHEKGHKMIRYDEKTLFGKKFKDYEVNLNNLEKHFKDEIHHDIKCNICNKEPIEGLRFKCDICFDFNVCENCQSKSLGRHTKDHPLLAICKTLSSEIEYDQIEIDKDKWLGEGGFGNVYIAKFKENVVACKKIKSEEIISIFVTESTNAEYEKFRKSYMRELKAYNEIKSDNILKMIGYSTNQKGPLKELVILTEYMEKGSLSDLLRNEPNLSYKMRFSIAGDIAAGMAKMHKIGFIHRDIRPDNILVNAKYVAKIGDMGIAKVFYLFIYLLVNMITIFILIKVFHENSDHTIGVGFILYMPPEFYIGDITPKLDIFTYGLTLNKLFNGKHTKIGRKIQIQIIKKCELIFDELVQSMIRLDPHERPTSKIVNDKISFFNSFINESSDSGTNESFSAFFSVASNEYHEKKLKEDNDFKKEKNKMLLDYFNKNLKDIENLNPKSFKILNYLNQLSWVYQLENDSEKCVYYLDKYLDKANELFPGNTAENADALARAGYIFLNVVKDAEIAIGFYDKALEIRNGLLKENDPDLVDTYYRQGECYQKLNQPNPNQALELHLKALELRKNIYDENSRFIVDSLDRIKECYLSLNDIDNHLKFRKEANNIKKNVFKNKNSNNEYKELLLVRRTENGNPAWHYVLIEDDDKYEEFIKLKKETNIDLADYGKIIQSGWGESSPEYIDNHLKSIYDVEFDSKFKQININGILIKNLIDDDLKIEHPILYWLYDWLKMEYDFYNGKENIYIIKALINICDYYYIDLDDSYNCILLANKVREISLKLFDNKENEYSSMALETIAGCYSYIQKESIKALEEFTKLLKIREGLYEKNHPLIAKTLNHLGNSHFELKEFDKALEYYHKSLAICRKIYHHLNKYLLRALQKIEDCYEKMGKIENYLKYRREELEIKRELFKKKNPNKEYKDVFLIRGHYEGRPSWHYILIENEEKYEELKKQKKGTNIDVTDFGRIIKSGRGLNPSKNIIEEIDKEYEFEFD